MPELAEEVKANVLEAQRFTRKHLVVELDLSPDSVRELENHFDAVEYALKDGKSDENVEFLARIWGTYIGEVLRRECGGEWVREETANGPRLALRGKNQTIYPHEQVRQRLAAGADQSIWIYYERMQEVL
jgi:hypothetical protein